MSNALNTFNISVALTDSRKLISTLSAFNKCGFQIHGAVLVEMPHERHVRMEALYKGRSTEQADALSRALAACGQTALAK